MADSSDSESSPSMPERSTHKTATEEAQPQPQPVEKDNDDSHSSSSRDSSPSPRPPSPKTKEKSPSPPANQTKDLKTQQKYRLEASKQADAKRRQAAKDLVEAANRQRAAKDEQLKEARRLEEEEAQARRREFVEPAAPTTGYSCADCNKALFLGLGDPVRCRACGCRILHKKRTNRLVHFLLSPFSFWMWAGVDADCWGRLTQFRTD